MTEDEMYRLAVIRQRLGDNNGCFQWGLFLLAVVITIALL